MAPLIFIIIALALTAGFLALARWEQSRGARLFAVERARLDRAVERAAFIATHVDWNAYLRDAARAQAIRTGHFVAHRSLQGVRAVERFLTETVRHLRARVASEQAPSPGASTRPFVQALGDFKEELKVTPHPVPEL